MRTHKDSDLVEVKFLVFEELVPSCILGIDGQDQLKIKLDREQDLVWVNGMPITLHQSEQEAKFRLGAVSLEESFGNKISKMDGRLQTDYYKPNVDDDALIHHSSMSFEVIEGSSDEVEIDSGHLLLWLPHSKNFSRSTNTCLASSIRRSISLGLQ